MTVTLRRVDPTSLARIYAAVYAILGLLFGLPAACVMSLVGSAAFGDAGGGLGLLAVVLYPVIGAVAGFIGGLLTAAIYNLAADKLGGVEMTFDDDDLVAAGLDDRY